MIFPLFALAAMLFLSTAQLQRSRKRVLSATPTDR
jgi:hypothetical protein